MTYVDAFLDDILRYAAGFLSAGNIAERCRRSRLPSPLKAALMSSFDHRAPSKSVRIHGAHVLQYSAHKRCALFTGGIVLAHAKGHAVCVGCQNHGSGRGHGRAPSDGRAKHAVIA